MMDAFGKNDMWVISSEDRAKHEAQFLMQNPVGGYISGEQAKQFFLLSGLSTVVLGHIWKLADLTADGRMDRKEFSIAMHLIKKSLLGYQLPQTLPSSLLADPPPLMAVPVIMPPLIPPMAPPSGCLVPNISRIGMVTGPSQFGLSNQLSPLKPTVVSTLPMPPSIFSPGVASAAINKDWTMSSTQKTKYVQMFSSNDRLQKGFLNGLEAKAILSLSGLPKSTLAQIWNLADFNRDGNLSMDEFCVAMHLSDAAKCGQSLPLVLPRELMPCSAQRTRHASGPSANSESFLLNSSVQSFETSTKTLSGSSAICGDLASVMSLESFSNKSQTLALSSHATFEDRRKENFERGQAELERRREMLRETQRKEMEDRLAFEKSEQEKREKHRLEQELRKQKEFERQREHQRLLEVEKEEQRRKAIEHREAARQELERQRHMEWQHQRRDQLMAEKIREQSQVDKLGLEVGHLRTELSTLDNKKLELHAKIEQAKCNIADFTSSIESMRVARDSTVAKNDHLSSEFEQLKQSLVALRHDRKPLEEQVNSLAPTEDENFISVAAVYKRQKDLVERLQSKLKDIEQQKSSIVKSIEGCGHQLIQLKTKMDILRTASHRLKNINSQKKADMKQKSDSNSESSYVNDNGSLNSTITQSSNSYNGYHQVLKAENDAENIIPLNYRKFTANFQFDARSLDELSLVVGDVVLVPLEQKDVPTGWLTGRLRDKQGLFPESYVTLINEELSNLDSTVPEILACDPNTRYSNLGDSSTSESEVKGDMQYLAAGPGTTYTPSPTPDSAQNVNGELYARAMYQWRAKKDYHLTFNKGDEIKVTMQQVNWWYGEFDGKVGWFPKCYVQIIEDSEPTPAGHKDTENEIQPINASKTRLSSDSNLTSASHTSANCDSDLNTGEWYVASYAYSSTESGDLTFNAGDVINVISAEGDWWKGILNGRMGDFPGSYVKKYDASASFNNQKTKKPVIATVVVSYESSGPEQLSLQVGQLINVRKRSPSGWWEGELQARGQKKRIGWFPANYVKLLGQESGPSTPDATTPTSPRKKSVSVVKCNSPVVAASTVEQVIAIYDYQAQREDELSFFKGSVINVISKDGSEWWQGELNGRTGLLPFNYVKPLSDYTAAEQLSSQSSESPEKNGSTIDMNSEMEKKRQDHIQELIATEETYVKDLTTVLEVFCKPFFLNKILTEGELNVIFINWKEVRMCNMKLLKAMRVRKKLCEGQPIHLIGDILCENLIHMSPYIRFCSCQLNSAALLQKKYETDNRFKDAHKKCCMDSRTLGLPLSSFLLKPMQRITKYPLLIEKVFKHTSTDHPDYHNLQEALSKATELCNQVNEGVREKENSDRLEWIQTHVHCDGLAEKITFNSLTNCMGPRKYVHSGTLYKVKSGKELVGILFNDFLLLAQSHRPLGSITSIFAMDTKTNIHLKMYRSPLFLNEVMIQKPADGDPESAVFHISHVDHTYNFRATTVNEKDNWVRKIESTSKQYLETERKKKEKAHTAHLMSNRGVGRLLVIVIEGINLVACDSNAGKKTPAVGRLLVVIVEGCNLVPGEDGKSDPYCEVSMGVQEHKTKVIQSTLNPKWNASMQFTIKDLKEDVLCITVYDRDLFSPNDFLGRTEVRICDIIKETRAIKGPITKRLLLHEVESGEVVVKLDLQLFGNL